MRTRSAIFRFAPAVILLLPLAAACVRRSAGETLYREKCAGCHGIDGSGNTPRYMGNQWANLIDNAWKSSSSDEYSLSNVIREGIFGDMPANRELSDEEVRQIVEWIRFLRGEAE